MPAGLFVVFTSTLFGGGHNFGYCAGSSRNHSTHAREAETAGLEQRE
jgi:hypothetical protein